MPRIRTLQRRVPAPRRIQADVVRRQLADQARRARRQLVITVPLLLGVVALYRFRVEVFGVDRPVRYGTAVALLLIGWAVARGLGRALAPQLYRRVDPSTAGVAGFVIRLITLGFMAIVALRFAGLKPGTIALGASFTAVVFGLAAQQTFGNLIAGMVLISARPFGIDDRVLFKGYGFDVEGTVRSFGLLYVTLADGEDTILLPNSTALTMSVRPLREPAGVNVRAVFSADVDPEEVEERIKADISVRTRYEPHIELEEVRGDEVFMRVRATPERRDDGPRLAREVLAAVNRLADGPAQEGDDRFGSPLEHARARASAEAADHR